MAIPGYPQIMVHPQHRPAKIHTGDARQQQPNSPERFPSVEVYTPDQEERERARGYVRFGEQMTNIPVFNEFPKIMRHPGHVDAVKPTQGARMENGAMITYPIPGTQEVLPDVTVANAGEQEFWERKGYRTSNSGDRQAFELAIAAPGEPGTEYPKWVEDENGNRVLMQDPDLPEDLSFYYPKWVHFEGGESVLAQDPAHEERVLKDREAKRVAAEKQPASPYIPLPEPQPVTTSADFEEFMQWKAWKAEREATAAAQSVQEEPATPSVDTLEAERQELFNRATEAGIEVDKRWGARRLREALARQHAA